LIFSFRRFKIPEQARSVIRGPDDLVVTTSQTKEVDTEARNITSALSLSSLENDILRLSISSASSDSSSLAYSVGTIPRSVSDQNTHKGISLQSLRPSHSVGDM
jgi:hypothetical protein